MSKRIIISGASSGFGALTARALADVGHTVYAGMRDTTGHNLGAVRDAAEYASTKGVDLRSVELDMSDQASVDGAVAAVTAQVGGIDVVIHNAGHMGLGPTESFTPEQLAQIYDTNVVSTQRLNRAILPQMRERRDGLLVWVGSSSTFGGTPPYLGAYFAAKGAMDQLAKSYAVELSRFGIDTSLIIPGSFTHGTNHFAHAEQPADKAIANEYEELYAGLLDQVAQKLAKLAPANADVADVARAIVTVVDTPKGSRPFRVTIDPADDGTKTVSDVNDRIRHEFYERIELTDLLAVSLSPNSSE